MRPGRAPLRTIARLLILGAALTPFVHPAASARSETVIVKYRRGVSAVRRKAISRRYGLEQAVGTVRAQRARVVRVSGDPLSAVRRLNETAGVLYAEPNSALRIATAPNDPLFGQLSGLAAIDVEAGWSVAGLGAFPATGGVPIGIVDTGIDRAHEDLVNRTLACATSREGRFTEGACADDNDHGTHVAGTAGAAANNGIGVAGVAFNSPLVVCKALGGDGSGTTADVANCIGWVHAQGAKVISMSLGGPSSITLQNAVSAAWKGGRRSGSLLVAAAGNEGSAALDYPAGYPQVVSVSATDSAGRHARFSNSNSDVEISAPGVDVLSAKRSGGYVRFSGTSMATPHVAGAAALIWELRPRVAARTVRDRLDATVRDLGPDGRDDQFGFGMLDLGRLPAG